MPPAPAPALANVPASPLPAAAPAAPPLPPAAPLAPALPEMAFAPLLPALLTAVLRVPAVAITLDPVVPARSPAFDSGLAGLAVLAGLAWAPAFSVSICGLESLPGA